MSWRTSLAGVLVIVSQLAALLPSVPSWLSTVLHVLGALAGGAGLVLARDHAAPVVDPAKDAARAESKAIADLCENPTAPTEALLRMYRDAPKAAPSEDGKADA